MTPTELRRSADKTQLHVTWDNGSQTTLTAATLRTESPSAEVQGHHPSEKKTVVPPANLTITNLEPVGNYAVRITFSDGHRTGLYTWDYLATLAAAA